MLFHQFAQAVAQRIGFLRRGLGPCQGIEERNGSGPLLPEGNRQQDGQKHTRQRRHPRAPPQTGG